ncbi:efflux RND transporter permease subunit, partial [Arthrospira platensis SPKY1]|nr:efflux RND transporter permease subunit [Arthrospira platensis SPKY1]
DIAIAITFSILLSLFVSISVIPSLTDKLLEFSSRRKKVSGKPDEEQNGKPNAFVRMIMILSHISLKNWFTRTVTIAALTLFSVAMIVMLVPKAEYLPQGNRNLVLNIMVPPPGYSVEKR